MGSGIAFHSDGRLVIAESGKNRIVTVDSKGEILNVAGTGDPGYRDGDAIGTLNEMKHVHLIAGSQGFEINALDALDLPGPQDTKPPIIDRVQIFTSDWKEIETDRRPIRINRLERLRIVVTAYDRMDGNPERRRLGVY
ncbi:MAG: hypothetical protein C4325_06995 [Blastocatellia bacterium]